LQEEEVAVVDILEEVVVVEEAVEVDLLERMELQVKIRNIFLVFCLRICWTFNKMSNGFKTGGGSGGGGGGGYSGGGGGFGGGGSGGN
jgi:uncharacterized membrane protein YgcG